MACNPSPTLTLFGTTTSSSVYTTFSASESSLPSVVTTSQSAACVATVIGSDNLTTCASTSTIDEVNTIPGGETPVQVPIVTTVFQTQSFPTQTLFDTCNDNGGQTTQQNSPAPKPSSTTVPTMTTPPPVVVTSSSTTTLPNGSAVVTTVVVTSTQSPSYVYAPTPATDPQGQGDHTGGHSNAKLGPIIGGSVGGFIGLLGLVGLVWFILRRRKAWDDIFDRDDGMDFRPSRLVRDPRARVSLDVTPSVEPKPYQYGLIGQATAPPPHCSPPGSPTGQSHPQHDNGQGWSPDYNHSQPYSPDYNQNASGSGQHPQHIMHDHGQSYSPDYNQNARGSGQQHTMHDNGQSYTPNYNQNPQQYSPDHQHQRHPSGTSLLYTPLVLPTTRISPEPSVASVYSSNSRPGYSRDSSGSRLAMMTGNSRPSTGGSVGSRPSMDVSLYSGAMAAQVPQTQRRQRRPSRPDEFGVSRPSTAEYGPRPPSASDQANLNRRQSSHSRKTSSSGRPTSPRVLALTNWNPSTDNVTLDNPSRPPMASTSEQPRHRTNPSATTIPADSSRLSGAAASSGSASAQAGPSSRPENVILHTDGGRVQEENSIAPTGDVKEIPSQAPPAYSE